MAALCMYPGLAQAQTVSPTSVDIEVNESNPIASAEVTLSTDCEDLNDVGLDWSASVDSAGPASGWLTVSPTQGDQEFGDVPITLLVNADSLEPGAYQAAVTIQVTTDCDGNPLQPAIEETVEVNLQILPIHGVEPTELTFRQTPNDPPAFAQFLYRTGCDVPGRTWSAEVGPPNGWLTISLTGGTSGTPAAGFGDIPIRVFADPAGLEPGTHIGTITISSTDCQGQGEDNPMAATVEVEFEIVTDLDGDGVEDADDNCPSDPNPGQEDTDQDGVGDACDNCPDMPNTDQSNSDGDSWGDACDNCPGIDNFDQADSDADGAGDDCDICPGGDDTLDADGDGVPDFCDACPLDNPDDTDGDGVCDSDDTCPGADDALDVDGDGVSDGCDNCPSTENASQEDDDLDGVGDACDVCPGEDDTPDADSDGVPDCNDQCPGEDDNLDTDEDQVADCMEECPLDSTKTEPGLCGCGVPDTDHDEDTVPDCDDLCEDTPPNSGDVDVEGCIPSQRDSDRDGVTDDIDQCPNTPPNRPVAPNGCTVAENDLDSDGVLNDDDLCPDTPFGQMIDGNGCSDFQLDSDGDSVNDAVDQCPNTPAGNEVDLTGCTIVVPAGDPDLDGDGVPNDLDLCPTTGENVEVDSTGCAIQVGLGGTDAGLQPESTDLCGAGLCGSSSALTMLMLFGGLGLLRWRFRFRVAGRR